MKSKSKSKIQLNKLKFGITIVLFIRNDILYRTVNIQVNNSAI